MCSFQVDFGAELGGNQEDMKFIITQVMIIK